MKLRTLFLLDVVVSLLFALAFLLGPAIALKFFGLTTGKTETLLAQVIGASLVGFAGVCWFAKDYTEAQAIQGAVLSLMLYSAIGFVVTLLGVLSQVTRSGSAWLVVIIYLLFTAGFAYFQFAGPRE